MKMKLAAQISISVIGAIIFAGSAAAAGNIGLAVVCAVMGAVMGAAISINL